MSKIMKGDGSWQERLDQQRCPKCGASLQESAQVLGSRYKVTCTSCKLTIIDSTLRSDTIRDDTMPSEWEGDMYETRLMPTEEQILSDQSQGSRIAWHEAVSVLEKVLDHYLYDPEPVDEGHENEVLGAWRRILQG